MNRICKGCGKIFYVRETNNKKKFCNAICYNNTYTKTYDKRYTYQRTRFKVFERDKFKCIYCGMSSIEDEAQLQLEHILPKSEFPSQKINESFLNMLVTSCIDCNQGKGTLILNKDIFYRIINEVEKRKLKQD